MWFHRERHSETVDVLHLTDEADSGSADQFHCEDLEIGDYAVDVAPVV